MIILKNNLNRLRLFKLITTKIKKKFKLITTKIKKDFMGQYVTLLHLKKIEVKLYLSF
jgi:hypothetical protein